MARNHRPCIKCGDEHKNPMSSSLCPSCGKKAHVKNSEEALREYAREEREHQESLTTGEALDELLGLLIEEGLMSRKEFIQAVKTLRERHKFLSV